MQPQGPSPSRNWSCFKAKALDNFDQIDNHTLLRGGQELWNLKPLVPVASRLWAVWLGILAFPLLTCIGALVIQAKIFSFVVRGLAEGDRFHVGHEAQLKRASKEEELRAQLVEEFSRLRREDEARTTASVGSLASLVFGSAAENQEEGSASHE